MVRELCEDEKSSRVEMGSSSNGFCYSDVPSSGNNPTIPIQTHLVNHIQGFVTDPEMFNLTTGMEMIGFSKHNNLQQQSTDSNNAVMWKSFLGNKPGQHEGPSSSSSKTMNESCSPNFYHHHHQHEYINKQDFTSGVSEISAPWQENRTMLVDDSSLRCVFPCEGQERPSQGLSLSLSSTNPSTIGLQSFELRHTSPTGHNHQHQQQVLLQQDNGYYSMNSTKAANVYQGHFLLKNSKFLVPAQDLLKEICSLGTRQSDVVVAVPKQKSQKNNKQWEEDNNAVGGCSSSLIIKHSLSSIELVELQKRKTKLLSMLEEVDRRYRHYCNQMKAVVSSFEAVAGNGAATVYSVLALKAMSRHFRCLKDGILDQIQATRKAMGEKNTVAAPGTTRGETPRLRVLDQALRQQRAFQQINMMETHPWRPQRGLPERAVSVLRAWLFEHFLHPYPSDVDKHILARQAGLSRSQVSNWFINARVRLWKPMVEEMYLEEEKEKERQKNTASSEGGTNNHEEEYDVSRNNVENPSPTRLEDQKPTHAIDADCVSSIINNNNNNNNPDLTNDTRSNLNPQLEQCGSRRATTDTFGSVDLDFSSYTCAHQGFHGGGGSGVSLTLGLQQHGGSGVSLAFPSAPTQNPVFYTTRDQMEECQPVVQYSLLDGEGGQNMQYRNLMGTPLLHDLA